ncbi:MULTISPECIES: ATP-binding protein [Spirosoma]|uniref:histidine kinase n=1 Tax=Spirosoma sordidisoli TaxID=2502893 RepID=A0A4Q2UL74_9BACT|nr:MULTISPECIES: ATP-binding protein [Spirosoma]RYC68421.1 hypothetical protein EQG79_18860 [Spirosoma sordidisoli]
MKMLLAGITLLVLQTAQAQSSRLAQLRHQLTKAQHDTARIRLYIELAQLYSKHVTPDSAYYMAMKGISLAHKHGLSLQESALYLHLGYYYKRKANYPEAQSALQTGLRLSEKNKPDSLRIKLLYRLSCIYGDQGMYEKTIEAATATLRLATQLKDTVQMCYASNVLTSAYLDTRNKEMALTYAHSFYQLASQIDSRNPRRQAQLIMAGLTIADIYEQTGQYAEAYPYIERSFAHTVSLGDFIQTSEIAIRLGKNLVKQRRSGEAIRHIDKALRENLTNPDASEPYETYALAYRQLGQLSTALAHARKAHRIALKKGHLKQIQSTLETLALLEEDQHMYASAVTHLRQLNTINDSLFTVQKAEAIARVETRYQVTQHEQTIQLLQKDASLRQVSLARKQADLLAHQERQTLLILLTIFLLTLAGGLLIVFLHEKNVARLLAAQKADIEDKARQLEEVNSIKDNLFAILGHDLRSPIANLKTQLNGIKEGFISPKEFRSRIDGLRQKVDSVYTTLDNLLHFSLLQRKGMRSFLTQVDLAETIESVVQLYDADIMAKRLTLQTAYSATPVWADEHQLHIVGRNILQNAIKFTPVGGSIHIITQYQSNRSKLIIKDSGVGMEISHQLNPTDQNLNRRGTAGERGTGLGLQICRELVQLNQGQLHIESQPGHGTTVTVEFGERQQTTSTVSAFLQ